MLLHNVVINTMILSIIIYLIFIKILDNEDDANEYYSYNIYIKIKD